jgi:hypothetical protein
MSGIEIMLKRSKNVGTESATRTSKRRGNMRNIYEKIMIAILGAVIFVFEKLGMEAEEIPEDDFFNNL